MLATTSSTGKVLNINTTLTLAHTVDNGTDVLVVIVGANDSTTADMDVTGVTWDAAGVNEALSWVVGSGDGASATNEEIWHKISPTAKAANITITFAAKTTAGNADALNLDGVDTDDAVAASQRSTGSNSDPDVQTGRLGAPQTAVSPSAARAYQKQTRHN